MRPLAPLFVSSLIATLLPGCIDSGKDCGGGADSQAFSDEVDVGAETFNAYAGEDGVMSDEECLALCEDVEGFSAEACSIRAIPYDGNDTGGAAQMYTLVCDGTIAGAVCMGRPPAGLQTPTARLRGAGAWAAHAASMEAVSVRAFLELDASLGRLGAPEALRRSARRAACDEVRHTRLMARIARRHGVPIVAAAVSEVAAPDRAGLAVENAVNGCVHETWSALIARHQAIHAPDAGVRTAMGSIATDEAEHAELAWAIQEWLANAADERAVQSAVAAAITQIRADLLEQADDTAAALGLPLRAEALTLLDVMARTVWAAHPE